MENFLHYLKYTLIVARIGFLSETENITGQNCIHLLTYFKKKELKLVTDCISRCILSRHSFSGLMKSSVQSIDQSCLTFCDRMNCSTAGPPVHHQFPELTQTHVLMSIMSVMPSNYLILCHPLLILPSVFPTIRVFSNESVLRNS